MRTIKNYTPHIINICDKQGNIFLSIPSSGIIRLKTTLENKGDINGIPLVHTQFGQAEGLPEREDNTFFIVSQIIKSAYPERNDFIVPSEVIRDDNGSIIGCYSFSI